MRILLFLLLSTISLFSRGQTSGTFPPFKFDKVVIYDYEPNREDPSLVNDKVQISNAVKIKKQVQIDKATTDGLNAKLGNNNSYGNISANCFEPHLGIVYYLNNRIVGNVLICLDCNSLRSSFDITAQQQGKAGEGDKVYYLNSGMSKSFRQFLNNLLKKYTFSHQINKNTAFDK